MTGSGIKIEQGSDTDTKGGEGPDQRGGGEQRLEIPGSKAHIKMSDRQYQAWSNPTQSFY